MGVACHTVPYSTSHTQLQHIFS